MNALKHYSDSEFHETAAVLEGLTSPLESIRFDQREPHSETR